MTTTQEALGAKGMTEVLLVNAAERRGIDIGLCMAAAVLVRDFDRPSLAEEILGAGGIDRDRLADLDLDEYDAEPLLKLWKE